MQEKEITSAGFEIESAATIGHECTCGCGVTFEARTAIKTDENGNRYRELALLEITADE